MCAVLATCMSLDAERENACLGACMAGLRQLSAWMREIDGLGLRYSGRMWSGTRSIVEWKKWYYNDWKLH